MEHQPGLITFQKKVGHSGSYHSSKSKEWTRCCYCSQGRKGSILHPRSWDNWAMFIAFRRAHFTIFSSLCILGARIESQDSMPSFNGLHSLECTITWNNVAGLMNISHKLCVPTLQNECRTFLLTHAAGKPIKAMRIAELYQEEDLYRESSRFVLDNPGGWTEQELGTLTQETLLKLEKR
jgi:hypothetical protein